MFRSRSLDAFCWLAMALAVAGVVAAGLENISFGHEHLAGGEALHHHHVYLGSHGHEDDHGREHGHGEEHGQEDGHEQEDGPGSATVSAAPALFQPVPVSLLVAVLAESPLLVPLPAPAPPARLALPPSPPRGPPLSLALFGL